LTRDNSTTPYFKPKRRGIAMKASIGQVDKSNKERKARISIFGNGESPKDVKQCVS
jgi:hypothetical protein